MGSPLQDIRYGCGRNLRRDELRGKPAHEWNGHSHGITDQL
jgi:hypothetical protein